MHTCLSNLPTCAAPLSANRRLALRSLVGAAAAVLLGRRGASAEGFVNTYWRPFTVTMTPESCLFLAKNALSKYGLEVLEDDGPDNYWVIGYNHYWVPPGTSGSSTSITVTVTCVPREEYGDILGVVVASTTDNSAEGATSLVDQYMHTTRPPVSPPQFGGHDNNPQPAPD